MNNTNTNNSAARAAGQKFIVGDKISWKGGPAIVREVRAQSPWPSYIIECDNGKHVLEFADQSFCDLIADEITDREAIRASIENERLVASH